MEPDVPPVASHRRYPSLQRIFVAALVLLLAWLAWYVRGTLIPYIVGIFLVALLNPLVRLVEKHAPGRNLQPSTRRRLAGLSVYVGAVIVFVLFCLFLARPILSQVTDLILGVPEDWHKAISENPTIHNWYVETIPADTRAEIEKSLAAVSVDAATWLQRSVTRALNTAAGLLNAIVTIAAVGLFVFYVMIRDERIPSAAGRWISRPWQTHLRQVREIAHRTITSYARGLLTEATIVGGLTGIGLFLAGIHLALPLAIISGFFNLIPYVGYWLALLLSIVVVAGTQPDKLLLAIAIYLLVQAVDNWYFAPHYQGGSTGWTPAQTLVIMACGSALMGPIGLVFSLPLAAFIRETLLYTYHELPGPVHDDRELPRPAPDLVGHGEPASAVPVTRGSEPGSQ